MAYRARMITFGDRLRAARIGAGKTQEHVGAEVGVTKATVSAWENNRDTPSFQYLAALRTSVGVSLDELVCDDIAKGRALGRAFLGEDRESYGPSNLSRAQSAHEFALLLRFRALPAERQRALLDFIKPDRPGAD